MLHYLWHPGTKNNHSGYGLATGQPNPIVGILMVDRPIPVDPIWLQRLADHYGSYDLTIMTRSGERGLLASMWVEPDSLDYLRRFPGSLSDAIADALQPLVDDPPKPQLIMAWNYTLALWVSEFKLEGVEDG